VSLLSWGQDYLATSATNNNTALAGHGQSGKGCVACCDQEIRYTLSKFLGTKKQHSPKGNGQPLGLCCVSAKDGDNPI